VLCKLILLPNLVYKSERLNPQRRTQLSIF